MNPEDQRVETAEEREARLVREANEKGLAEQQRLLRAYEERRRGAADVSGLSFGQAPEVPDPLNQGGFFDSMQDSDSSEERFQKNRQEQFLSGNPNWRQQIDQFNQALQGSQGQPLWGAGALGTGIGVESTRSSSVPPPSNLIAPPKLGGWGLSSAGTAITFSTATRMSTSTTPFMFGTAASFAQYLPPQGGFGRGQGPSRPPPPPPTAPLGGVRPQRPADTPVRPQQGGAKGGMPSAPQGSATYDMSALVDTLRAFKENSDARERALREEMASLRRLQMDRSGSGRGFQPPVRFHPATTQQPAAPNQKL